MLFITGHALWNANGTSVDMLLKQPEVQGATKLLAGANVRYNVIIDDLQREIDEENPEPSVTEQLQFRQGKNQFV